jgi:hypothetical protein
VPSFRCRFDGDDVAFDGQDLGSGDPAPTAVLPAPIGVANAGEADPILAVIAEHRSAIAGFEAAFEQSDDDGGLRLSSGTAQQRGRASHRSGQTKPRCRASSGPAWCGAFLEHDIKLR